MVSLCFPAVIRPAHRAYPGRGSIQCEFSRWDVPWIFKHRTSRELPPCSYKRILQFFFRIFQPDASLASMRSAYGSVSTLRFRYSDRMVTVSLVSQRNVAIVTVLVSISFIMCLAALPLPLPSPCL